MTEILQFVVAAALFTIWASIPKDPPEPETTPATFGSTQAVAQIGLNMMLPGAGSIFRDMAAHRNYFQRGMPGTPYLLVPPIVKPEDLADPERPVIFQ